MHRIRNSNHRKVLKPQGISPSPDDDFVELTYITGKSINKSNPIIKSLKSKMPKQKLSDKTDIYDEAVMEANKIMFGHPNPGRCLTKEEIECRQRIIRQCVSDRLKSNLPQSIYEFNERIEMNDTDSRVIEVDSDSNECNEDDDSIPEAPPPPSFNTSSSESSDDDIDFSITEEFESYEKEMKHKIPVTQSTLRPASQHSIQFCSSDASQETRTLQPIPIYENRWWTTNESAPWIPPVGPPQSMDPFPPPIESEIDMYLNPPPNTSTFAQSNSSSGWMPSPPFSWNQSQPRDFLEIPRSSPAFIDKPSPYPMHPQMHSLTNQMMELNPPEYRFSGSQIRHEVPYNQAATIQLRRNTIHTSSNHFGKPKIETFIGKIGTKPNETNSRSVREIGNELNFNSMDGFMSQKRSNDKIVDRTFKERISDSAHNANSNEINKRVRLDDSTYGSPHEQNQQRSRSDTNRSDRSTSSDYRIDRNRRKSPRRSARHDDLRTLKILSPFWNTNKRLIHENTGDVEVTGSSVPNEWKDLCDIVDKLFGLLPNRIKDIPSTDRQIMERSELLMILSDDPESLLSQVDKYGEENVKQAVKIAKRILCPHGRYDDDIALKIAPFQKAIHVAINRSERDNRPKQETMPPRNAQTKSNAYLSRQEIMPPRNEQSKSDAYLSRQETMPPRNEQTKSYAYLSRQETMPPRNAQSKSDAYLSRQETMPPRNAQSKSDTYPSRQETMPQRNAQSRSDAYLSREETMPPRNAQSKSDAYPSRQETLTPRDAQKKSDAYLSRQETMPPRNAQTKSDAYLSRHETMPPRNEQSNSEATPKEWVKLCSIVDELLGIPSNVIGSLSSTDSLVKERNDILMILSNDPEDFLLHDEKYGARSVDRAILAAKRILYVDNVRDERVRKIMMRQRDKLKRDLYASNHEQSSSRNTESERKSKNEDNGEHRSRSLPKEWNLLCDIVDKVLDTPKEVRVKMSKRDPRWEQRENILLTLSDDPDKLASKSTEFGAANVDWAIRVSKKILLPNGTKDRSIFKKLSQQRRLLLRGRQSSKEEKTVQKMNDSQIQVKDLRELIVQKSNDVLIKDEKKPSDLVKKDNVDEAKKTNKSHGKASSCKNNLTADKEIDVNEVWKKLCNIVDKLLDLPPNAAEKMEPSNKRLIERNDILMVLSDEPDNFAKFDSNYGNTNVAWAINSAKKLIVANGKNAEKLNDALWKQRDAIMSAEESSKDAPSNECKEWIYIRKIAAKLFRLSDKTITNANKLSKEQLHQQIELLLQLSDNPDTLRSTPICGKIGEGCVEVAITKCKHLLHRLRTLNSKSLSNFEDLRNKMVLYSESLKQSKNIKNYNDVLAEVRKIVDEQMFNEIFGQSFSKWTQEQKLERNELAIQLIKDPLYLASSTKYKDMVRKLGKSTEMRIIEDVKKCLSKCEYMKEEPTVSVTCAPIVAKIKDEKYMNQFKERKLTQRIHRLIEQFLIAPKPEVFDIKYGTSDGTVDVVCANKLTFDWLKNSVKELDGLWPNAKLKISKAPTTEKKLKPHDLKEIKMTFKTVPTEPFAIIMKQLKKANPKLNSEKWQCANSSHSDPKKMVVFIDLESLLELERVKREILVDSGRIYFDISYIGEENFETEN